MTVTSARRSSLVLIAFAVVLVSSVAAFTSDKGKVKPVNDTARRATIKSVSLLSVYGPGKMGAGFSSFKEQALYDAIEVEIIKRLETSGLTVTPPSQTKALLDQEFYAAFEPNATKEMRKLGEKMRPAIDQGYMLRLPDSPTPSRNTRVLFGTSLEYMKPEKEQQTHANGSNEKDYQQPPAAYDPALMKTLVTLAPKFGSDGFLMLRVIPDIPTTVARKPSRFNPIASITTGVNAIRAIKEGDHGFVTLDLSLYTKAGELVFYAQIVKMSQETTGAGGGFTMTYGNDAATKLIESAAGLALQRLFEEFGK